MSLFADFIGGAAGSLKQQIDTSMLEDVRAKAEEKKMKLAAKISRGEIVLSNHLAGRREEAQASALGDRLILEQKAIGERDAAKLKATAERDQANQGAAAARTAQQVAARKYAADTAAASRIEAIKLRGTDKKTKEPSWADRLFSKPLFDQ